MKTNPFVQLNLCFKSMIYLILALGFLAPEAVLAEKKAAPKKEKAAEVKKEPRTPSPEGAEVYIISPKDGETVPQKFTVLFGLKGMGVAPAGVDQENTGHHHLMIDQKEMPPMDVPLDVKYVRHYGRGDTQTDLELKPGKHTLQLIFGDKKHIPHDPPVISKKITITVK